MSTSLQTLAVLCRDSHVQQQDSTRDQVWKATHRAVQSFWKRSIQRKVDLRLVCHVQQRSVQRSCRKTVWNSIRHWQNLSVDGCYCEKLQGQVYKNANSRSLPPKPMVRQISAQFYRVHGNTGITKRRPESFHQRFRKPTFREICQCRVSLFWCHPKSHNLKAGSHSEQVPQSQ